MSLMISVSGIRGLVGQSLTPAVALEFAQSYGTLLDGGRVALARDTRPSGPLYEAAALAGLLAAGCEVTQLGVAMTPTVGRAIQDGQMNGGMIITASHNPEEWNGLKFLDDLGVAPDPQKARQIVEQRESKQFQQIKTGFHAPRTDDRAGRSHVDAVLGAVEVERAGLRGLRVVLDSINGAGCADTPALLRSFGCEVIHLNGEPTGRFAHRPEPIRENLGDLCAAVREHRAHVGFAQDPDADRLAIVDEHGTYIGEEYTLALAVWSVLSRRVGPVAANLSTSRMVDEVANRYGARVFRTPVGESHVARAMLANVCIIGGEGNGGVIDPRICYVRDSLSAMSLVLQLLAATGKSLSGLVAELPQYASIKQKLDLPDRSQAEPAITAVTRAFSDRRPNTSDGVRVDFEAGWIHLRASNTEPLLRIIVEGRTPADADKLLTEVRVAAGLQPS